jgi:hypothetical protein
VKKIKNHSFAPPNSEGDVAQLVEQRTENPCVGGSIPLITTFTKPFIYLLKGFFIYSLPFPVRFYFFTTF